MKTLEKIAKSLVAPGKGILATDESLPTIEKRFRTIGLKSTEEHRRTYREMLFRTRELHHAISGVILFEETLHQNSTDGTPLKEILLSQGILPGIKVDKGAQPLAGFPREKVTEGLDGLRDRLADFARHGAQFTKWRAVIRIEDNKPSRCCLVTNARGLARFAALSQEAGLVPIVEPEVLMDGSHSIQRCAEVTAETLHLVFNALFDHQVRLEGMLLKPNMIVSGTENPYQAGPEEVAKVTLQCFRRCVPAAVPGIVFLSGGQSAVTATANLNALNTAKGLPWQCSFSFGRALQAPALKAWGGHPDNTAKAQAVLLHRAKCNYEARLGRYDSSMENQPIEDLVAG